MRSFRGLAIVSGDRREHGRESVRGRHRHGVRPRVRSRGTAAGRRHGEDHRRPPAGRTHGANRQQRRLQLPGAAPRAIHRRSHANRRRHRLPRRDRRGRQGHPGRSRARHVDQGGRPGQRRGADGRPQVDRGQLQLHRRDHRIAAARAHLRGPVPADSRRRRERLVRARRRRQPPGQHLPDRRRQHHQPGLRIALHRSQRVRHRRIQREARGHQRGVRTLVRLRRQRRHALGHQPLLPAACASK